MWSRTIISGQAQGPAAALLRAALAAAAVVYGGIVRLRNRLYDVGWLGSVKLSVPVISVGNITAGGTGKTPLVIWLAKYLAGCEYKTAVVSRGYKAKAAGTADNDEVKLLREELPQAVIIVDADRVRGGRRAIEEYGAEVIILDDGFQHRRLKRNLDIILIDCLCPFGYGWILPRGLLRESINQLWRAEAVVLSRGDMVGEGEREQVKQQVRAVLSAAETAAGAAEKKVILGSTVQPRGLYAAKGGEVELGELAGRDVVAFGGIGNPQSLVELLRSLGANVVGQKFYDDHHNYTKNDLVSLAKLRQGGKAGAWLVTTQKDWVKLKEINGVSAVEGLYWLKIETTLEEGGQELLIMIDKVMAGETGGVTGE